MILIIDDSDIAREAMRRPLEAAGLEVYDLPSPIGATRLILRKGIRVVIIDINMPTMRGDRLAALFRENPRFDDLRVILVSGEDQDLLQQLASQVGADAVVPKSANYADLVETVVRLLPQETEEA